MFEYGTTKDVGLGRLICPRFEDLESDLDSACVTLNHGYMVWDTLFGTNEKGLTWLPAPTPVL